MKYQNAKSKKCPKGITLRYPTGQANQKSNIHAADSVELQMRD
jgi:hypothetical protein